MTASECAAYNRMLMVAYLLMQFSTRAVGEGQYRKARAAMDSAELVLRRVLDTM